METSSRTKTAGPIASTSPKMSYPSWWQEVDFTKSRVNNFLEKHSKLLRWKDDRAIVLEVGCAEGSITKNILFPRIKDHVERLLAIDKDARMIELAQKSNRVEKIDYQVLDATDPKTLDRFENKFDHIFCFSVAHLIRDNRAFVNCLRKMLKPEGQLFITTVVDTPLHESFRKQESEKTWTKYLPDEPFLASYTDDPPGYFRNLVADLGFEVDACELDRGTFTVQNFPNFVKVILSFYEHLGRIPEELQEEYFQDHLKNCSERGVFYRDTNAFHMRYEMLVCVATKIA